MIMRARFKKVEETISMLTADEQQLLKDTINEGFWGDGDMEFLNENGDIETVSMFGYCTNDASEAGNYRGRVIATMFRSIYKKLCPANHNQTGRYISHCNNWWGNGNGDMLFIRESIVSEFIQWAKN